MNSLTISIFGNQTFLNIVNELKLFKDYKFISFTDFQLCINESKKNNGIIIFFKNNENKKIYKEIIKENLPLIIIDNFKKKDKKMSKELIDSLNMPFRIINLKNKITSLSAKYEFNKSSLISLGSYVIDKNQRKIKKENLELKLTEKEIDFLILFTENEKPLNRDFVLKKVWKYSTETDTHTIETHIHRLRKKIFQKFKDSNFIKNNQKGYYI
tara:strand:- start:1035 stop:1673 length:639 start_codon:yes stop_codon:yes gene_type:complete